MSTMYKLLYSDSISIFDFSLVLDEYNPEIGNFLFFSEMIYDAIEAGTLTPLPIPFKYDRPFRERDYKFATEVLLKWAERKNFKTNETKSKKTNEIKWLAAHHYKHDWQTCANKYKKENPKWKKPEIGNAIRSEYLKMDAEFPHSSATIQRNFSITITKK